MRRVKTWKWGLLGALIILGLYLLYPTMLLLLTDPSPEKADELRKKALRIGLDLKGGVHLVMEVDKSKLEPGAEEPIEESIQIIRNRIDQFGVTEPTIQKVGENRIIVELPGLANPQLAKEIIGKTALLEFKLLGDPPQIKSFIDSVDALLERNKELAQIIPTVEDIEDFETDTEIEKVDTTEDVEVKRAGDILSDDSSDIAIPSDLDSEMDKKLFSSVVDNMGDMIAVPPSEYEYIKELIERPEVKSVIPRGYVLAWGGDVQEYRGLKFKPLYVLRENAAITGNYLASASFTLTPSTDREAPNQPVVNLTFNKAGEQIFSRVTGANIDKRLAIVLDDVVHSAPTIQTRIRKEARITGIKSLDEARALAIVLRAGALPAPLIILEERTIGPTLGEDSIRRGVLSIMLGCLLIALFILIYYKGSGLIAVIAVALNLFFLMAAMATVRATLTLPGIAGIILTVGMAIDANVLIFERIREELKAGKSLAAAIDGAYAKVFWTIFDANLTTLLAGIVLYRFGTGPIRGFAITLIFGIILSFFTALFITRLFLDWVVSKKKTRKLSI